MSGISYGGEFQSKDDLRRKVIEFYQFLRESIDKIIRDRRTGIVDFPREVDNITRKPSSVHRSGLVCIGKIPIRMPGKCCQCTPANISFVQVKQIISVNHLIRAGVQFLIVTNIYPHEANQFTVTNGLIRFVNGWRAIRRIAITEARVAAAVVISTLLSETEITLTGTARTLKRKANRAVEITSYPTHDAPRNYIMHNICE